MNTDELKEIEEAKYNIEMGECLERLINNSHDFNKLILDNYLNKYAINLIYKISNANNSEEIQTKLISVSIFKEFLEKVKQRAESSKTFLEEINKQL